MPTPHSPELEGRIATALKEAGVLERKITKLLEEYYRFETLWKSRTRGVVTGLKTLRQTVNGEAATLRPLLGRLRRLSSEGAEELGSEQAEFVQRICTFLQCSNVPSQETSWEIVKRCHGLHRLATHFSRHYSVGGGSACLLCNPASGTGILQARKCPPIGHQARRQANKEVVWVDAVVDDGKTWLRIVSVSEKSLLFDMAAGGWDWDAGDDHKEEGRSGDENEVRLLEGTLDQGDEDDDDGISLVVMVRRLVEAARANRHQNRIPRLHIVLPRITESSNPEIARLIRQIRGMGRCRGRNGAGTAEVEIIVSCANSPFLTASCPPVADALANLLPKKLANLTSTVNLDCTVLIALVSDICHMPRQVAASKVAFQKYASQQLLEELTDGSSLVAHLYPALRSRRLVCTPTAAAQFWEIIDTIASPTEATRAAAILPRSPGQGRADPVVELQRLSEHVVDSGLKLPIEVAGPPEGTEERFNVQRLVERGLLPTVAAKVASSPEISELNRGIVFYGWVQGITTVTCNNTLAKQLMRLVDECRTADEEAGPNVWVHPVTRALLTKGKRGPKDEKSL
ncbi:hypothetical protein VTK73DRAFT_1519 [Phialemonium thermophilum]|uniref:DUF1308 domain-containing protein n=1 Tax=Phialemonium thermophilum TaxID=223376 RepID=A0ABR3X9P0_9PEZI